MYRRGPLSPTQTATMRPPASKVTLAQSPPTSVLSTPARRPSGPLIWLVSL